MLFRIFETLPAMYDSQSDGNSAVREIRADVTVRSIGSASRHPDRLHSDFGVVKQVAGRERVKVSPCVILLLCICLYIVPSIRNIK